MGESRKVKKQGNWFSRLLFWINIFFGISLAISYLSEYINPNQFWIPAFFGLAYPFLCLTNFLFIVYWLINRNWRFIFSLSIILIGYKELGRTVNLNFLKTKESICQGPSLKLMTYNVHSFKSLEFENNSFIRSQIMNIIRKENPDIIGFQEFFTKSNGEFDNLDTLKKILNNPYVFYHKVDSNKEESTGMALFSKFPLKNLHALGFEKSLTVNGILEGDIESPLGVIRFYCVHLQSIVFNSGDYAYLGRIKQKIKPELSSSKHIAGKLKIAFIKRADQAQQVRNSILDCKIPVLVFGDFNDTPVSYSFRTILGKMKSCFSEKGIGLGRTYNGIFPNFQIDHILCDTLFQVNSYKIIEKKLSDHFPVTTELCIRRKP